MANHESPKNSKRKGTKAALAASFAALLLCGATLVGTTFAWFTDTASTGNNQITAGNLDIELQVGTVKDGIIEYKDLEQGESIFGTADTANGTNETLWEPNATHIAYVKIINNGNLDLKYRVNLNAANEADGDNEKLTDVLQYKLVAGDTLLSNTDWESINNHLNKNKQTITAGDNDVSAHGTGETGLVLHSKKNAEGDPNKANEHTFALAIHMNKEADNRYKNEQVTFDLSVQATQASSESDSFGITYDENAEYEGIRVNVTDPATQKVTLDNDAVNSDKDRAVYTGYVATSFQANGQVPIEVNVKDGGDVVLDGMTITGPYKIVAKSNQTIKNLTLKDCTLNGSWWYGAKDIENITFENCTFNVTGAAWDTTRNSGVREDPYPIWIMHTGDGNYKLESLTVNNCTFNTSRGIHVTSGNDQYTPTVTITNNTFNINPTPNDKKVYTDHRHEKLYGIQLAGAGWESKVTVTGNTMNSGCRFINAHSSFSVSSIQGSESNNHLADGVVFSSQDAGCHGGYDGKDPTWLTKDSINHKDLYKNINPNYTSPTNS